MEIFLFWIVASVLIGVWGQGKSCGFFGAFLGSLFLSPLIGIIIVLASGPDKDAMTERIKQEEMIRMKIRKKLEGEEAEKRYWDSFKQDN